MILSAEQAAKLADKPVRVIPSRSVPAGLAAIVRYLPSLDAAENEAAMLEALEQVATGEVTVASRDVELDGVAVRKGAWLGLADGTAVASSPDFDEVAGRGRRPPAHRRPRDPDAADGRGRARPGRVSAPGPGAAPGRRGRRPAGRPAPLPAPPLGRVAPYGPARGGVPRSRSASCSSRTTTSSARRSSSSSSCRKGSRWSERVSDGSDGGRRVQGVPARTWP